MSSIEIHCQRVSTESIDQSIGAGRAGDNPPLLRVKVHGVQERTLLGLLSQLDPKEIVRQVGPRNLLDNIEEGEAKKHYGWT